MSSSETEHPAREPYRLVLISVPLGPSDRAVLEGLLTVSSASIAGSRGQGCLKDEVLYVKTATRN